MKKILFVLLLGIGFCYSLNLPAIVGNSGELIKIEAKITKGNGSVFAFSNGSIDHDTFSSIVEASKCASKFLGIDRSKYNFYVTFKEGGSYAGPSGGAGFAISFIASYLNKTFNNFTITGTIDENCNIGEVGGIFEKIASSKSLKLIILPKNYDLTYFIASRNFNVKIAQASNISEAFDYAFLNKIPSNLSFFSNISFAEKETPTSFQNVALRVYSEANKTFSKLNYSFDLDKVLSQDLELIKNGYSYAGGNDLFSKIIYANVLLDVNSSFTPSSVYSIARNVLRECNKIEEPSIGIDNYELVVSGMQRKTWGEIKVKEVLKQKNISNYEDAIYALVDVETARAWCKSSRFFFNTSTNQNFVLNQTRIMKIAEAELENASSIVARFPTQQAEFYLTSAQDAFSKANYAEAIMNAKWAIAFSSIPKPNSSVAISIAKLYSGVAKEYALEAQLTNSTEFAYLSMLVGNGFFEIKTSFVEKQNINNILAPIFFSLFLIAIILLLIQKKKVRKVKAKRSRAKPRT
jgi:predicted S18 family serine protease